MFVRVWWLSLIYTLAFWLYYERIMLAEEAYLKNKFGEEYDRYLIRTPAFIPNFQLWKKPTLPFSLRNVLKREYYGLFGIIAAFTAVEFVGDYVVEGSIVLDPVWVAIFALGAFTFVTLRTLKKTTRLLHVEGR